MRRARHLPMRLGMLALCALWLWVFVGCRSKSADDHSDVPLAQQVLILTPADVAAADPSDIDFLKTAIPDATWLPAEQLADGIDRCLDNNFVLLVPRVSHLSAEALDMLLAFQAKGGAVLYMGCDPLEAGVRRVNGSATTEAERTAARVATARPLEGLSAIQSWLHRNNTTRLRGAVRIADTAGPGWPGVLVDVEELDLWDGLISPELQGLPEGKALAFRAKGDAQTTRLVLEATTADGGTWRYDLRLTPRWEPYLVDLRQLRAQGIDEERLVPAKDVVQLRIGLDTRYAPQRPGAHQFGLSDIRLADIDRDINRHLGQEALRFTGSGHYALNLGPLISASSGTRYPLQPLRMQSATPCATGTGGDLAPKFRWLPLCEVKDEDGRTAGWPLSLYVEESATGVWQRWGWMGLALRPHDGPAARRLIEDAVVRLRRRCFLVQTGCERHALRPGEPLTVTAAWTPALMPNHTVRVAVELTDAHRYVLRRVVSDAFVQTPEEEPRTVLKLGMTPVLAKGAAEYMLRVSLVDAGGGDRVYDSLEQPIKIIAPKTPPHEVEWLSTTGARFTLNKRRVFLLGLDYAPQILHGSAPPAEHWLDPGLFNLRVVSRDLDALKAMGVNAVRIAYQDVRQAPQLSCFLDEAKKRNIWVCLYIAGLDPLTPDFDQAAALMRVAELPAENTVFAFELSRRRLLGNESERRVLDPAWRAWLNEAYGSVTHAEEVWGQPMWRIDGDITGPPDNALEEDGPHRAAVAAYRRFLDDYLSRRYGRVRRFARAQGCRQLLTAMTGYALHGAHLDGRAPIDAIAGATHLDFITAAATSLCGGTPRFYEAGFAGAYGRGVSDGKPFVWVDFRSPVGHHAVDADLAEQAAVHRRFFEMARRSQTAACFGYAGRYGDEVSVTRARSVLDPDGRWRPVGQVFQDFANELRRQRGVPRAWRGREIDRDAHPRGYGALRASWRRVYRKELADESMEEVRLVGFGKMTEEIPVATPGGGTYSEPAPLQSVNAEWGAVLLNGVALQREPSSIVRAYPKEELKLQLINTGPATWNASRRNRAGTVWVRAIHEQGRQRDIEVTTCGFGQAQSLTWTTSDLGRWTLRPYLSNAGPFGEPLLVDVIPNRPVLRSEP